MSAGKRESKDRQEGKNLSVWFPDATVASRLEELASRLNTSSSGIIYELVRKTLPAIDAQSDKRDISLDGIKVRV